MTYMEYETLFASVSRKNEARIMLAMLLDGFDTDNCTVALEDIVDIDAIHGYCGFFSTTIKRPGTSRFSFDAEYIDRLFIFYLINFVLMSLATINFAL
ncbi:hypothetical protein I2494_18050 [Budviciaceae bacterium BWR-B9]|uniref:Uncharacterized protein n=1 Tax=Limnobaculum allomyrinae TaxID=2791986 RepID=A0ABS1IWI0_9GAMM|nr:MULTISPECIES: hypothetical protein [Limnobaculum]MBK5145585.1 hypothetical protein [Limnobaculum allomyrinae]MBV7693703.1 hypothetical protein [Limnobaculum sp. M2-1]